MVINEHLIFEDIKVHCARNRSHSLKRPPLCNYGVLWAMGSHLSRRCQSHRCQWVSAQRWQWGELGMVPVTEVKEPSRYVSGNRHWVSGLWNPAWSCSIIPIKHTRNQQGTNVFSLRWDQFLKRAQKRQSTQPFHRHSLRVQISFMHIKTKNVGETHLPSESFVLDRMCTIYFPFKW